MSKFHKQCRAFFALLLLLWSFEVFFRTTLSAQTSSESSGQLSSSQSSQTPRVVRFGLDKIVGTSIFRIDAGGIFPTVLGKLTLQQQYRGRFIRTSSVAARDDEQLRAELASPISHDTLHAFSLVQTVQFAYSADSRDVGLDRLLASQVTTGARWKILPNLIPELHIGYTRNEQLGITDKGISIVGKTILAQQTFEDFTADANVQGEYTTLTNKRTNSQFLSGIRLAREFEGGDILEIAGQYSTQRRDFYTPFLSGTGGTQTAVSNPLTETRFEERLGISGKFLSTIADGLVLDLRGNIENYSVQRSANRYEQTSSITGVLRTLAELRFSLASTLAYKFTLGSFNLGFSLDSRDERNNTDAKFSITPESLSGLRALENQRDNSSYRSRCFGGIQIFISPKDTLRINSSFGLLRYDTPSNLNNDDRDELAILSDATFTHRFSHLLSLSVRAELQMLHVVFLKSSRSAQNNWNRIFRLAPTVTYSGKYVSFSSQFEVLANYTSFDFENLLGGAVQSFSFRQIGWRDSIAIRLNQAYHVGIRFTTRYFERGQFQWSGFSEIPQDKNHEIICSALLYHQPLQWARIGFGGRIYQLQQTPYSLAFSLQTREFLFRSLGPEVLLEFLFDTQRTLRLRGWYEFQSTLGSASRQQPNVILETVVPL